jgi:ComF family protein
MTFRSALSHHLKLASNAILPITCCLCEAPGEAFCPRCLPLLSTHSGLSSHCCTGCGLTQQCDCQLSGWSIDRTFALTDYAPPFDRLITDMKFHGQLYIAQNLGRLLGAAIASDLQELASEAIVAIPIPLSRERFLERGFNQAAQIAKGVVKKNPTLSQKPVLARQSAHRAQSLLTREERLHHLSNAYVLVSKPPRTALLIDDVMTTGATLNACANVLKNAGTLRVFVAVVGRTQRQTR